MSEQGEELEKQAEEYAQNHFGSIAARFHGSDEFIPNPTIAAYKAGALAERERIVKVIDDILRFEHFQVTNYQAQSAFEIIGYAFSKLKQRLQEGGK